MFLVILSKGQATYIITYGAIIKILDMQLQRESELEDKGQLFSFHEINHHCTIKGNKSRYEVFVNWEGGNVTWEPASVMRCDDPTYLAKYAHVNDLLDNPGQRHICCYVNNTKKINRLLEAAKAKQRRNTVKIKLDMKIPCDRKELMIFDVDSVQDSYEEQDF